VFKLALSPQNSRTAHPRHPGYVLDPAISALGSQQPNEAAAMFFIQAHHHTINADVQLCSLSLWMPCTFFAGALMTRCMLLGCHISSSMRSGCLDGAQFQSNCIAAKLTNLSFYKS
jgi:hypothetical protein